MATTTTDPEPDSAPDRSVSAAERTMTILNAFLSHEKPLSLPELEACTGLFKSVILRYMITLVRENMVRKNQDGIYQLGIKVVQLADVYEHSVDHLGIIKPSLERLVAASGETASFYVREGDTRVCLFRHNSPHSLRVSLRQRRRPVGEDLVAQFRALPVANISDSMARMSATGARLRPMHRGGVMAGPALTVRTRPGDNLMIHAALDLAAPGDIVVVDGGGDLTNALIGELMVAYARTRGIGGFVMNGAIRDVAWIAGHDFPVYAAGVTHRGPYKDGPGEINVPVAIDGMVIEPGDLVIGDADGLVCIPFDDAEAVCRAHRGERRGLQFLATRAILAAVRLQQIALSGSRACSSARSPALPDRPSFKGPREKDACPGWRVSRSIRQLIGSPHRAIEQPRPK